MRDSQSSAGFCFWLLCKRFTMAAVSLLRTRRNADLAGPVHSVQGHVLVKPRSGMRRGILTITLLEPTSTCAEASRVGPTNLCAIRLDRLAQERLIAQTVLVPFPTIESLQELEAVRISLEKRGDTVTKPHLDRLEAATCSSLNENWYRGERQDEVVVSQPRRVCNLRLSLQMRGGGTAWTGRRWAV